MRLTVAKTMPAVVISLLIAIAIVTTGSLSLTSRSQEAGYVHLSYIEPVHIEEAGLALDAKLDTGAASSSIRARVLNAEELNLEEDATYDSDEAHPPTPRLGELIRFEVSDPEGGNVRVLELPLVDMVRIKRKEGGFIYRPVVEMTFSINGRAIRERVNLAPRPNFSYAVLVGRNMLAKGNILVDSSRRSKSEHLTEEDASDR